MCCEEIKNQIKLLKDNICSSKELYKNNNSEIRTIFFISNIFMENILKDIVFVLVLISKDNKERYIKAILRLIVEQVIIYRNLMSEKVDNLEMCKDFLGYNINIEFIESSNISEYKKLKNIIGNRTKMYENKFYEMAKRFENPNEYLSFYKIYSLLSDYVHNSYYEDMLRSVENENIDKKEIYRYIYAILENINEGYVGIEKRYKKSHL